MNNTYRFVSGVLLATAFAVPAWGQNQGGTGGGATTGGFGGTGATANTGSTGRTTTGTTGTTNVLTGSSNSSSTTGSLGMNSGGTGTGTTLQSPTSNVLGKTGFLYPNNRKGFLIPSNSSTSAAGRTATSAGALGSSRLSSLGGAGGLGGLLGGGLGSNLGSAGQAGAAKPLRLMMAATAMNQQRVVVADAVLLGHFSDRLTRLPGMESLGTVKMWREGPTARLQGYVATTAQREQLARLALLEAGISSVSNELVVDPTQVEPETVPAVPASTPAGSPTNRP